MEFGIPNRPCFLWCMYLHVALLLLIMNLFHPTTFVKALGNETDRAALLKFKDAIVTDPHGVFNTWNDSVPFCSWHGITCSTRHQRVTALNLEDQGLHGTISPYIGNLSFLTIFDLTNNSFSGRIPQQVDRLFRLQQLNISKNMLDGEIPVNLTFCQELRIINFGENKLTGEIPPELGSLKKLVYLTLEINSLTGNIPPSLGNLSSLMILSLPYNNLVGKIPEEIGRLRSLNFFSVGPNKLSGMIPDSIFNMSSMVDFSLAFNEFEGTIPPAIGINMPNLQRIYLGANKFSGKIPASFSNATELWVLDIYQNNFEGEVPATLGDLPDLYEVVLGNNSLGSYATNDLEFLTALTNCSKLSILDMSMNHFGGVLPNSVANLTTQFTKFFLGGNQVAGTIPATLANLNNLIVLSLWDNMFTGVIPTTFGKFQKLQILSLYGNRLSGQIPSSVGNLTQLFEIYLYANELEGSIPPSIGNCLNMQEIDMQENRLSGEIPPQIIGLSSLLFLNLSHNSLNGSLHAEVGKLKNINTLDVSENNMTGEIPAIIGECLSLEFLLLQGNLFQDIIPSSLAILKALQYLDLSRNILSGEIPKDLERLPFLQYLNLSFNNLEGEVPREGAFLNTSAVSLAGNAKLCGGISKLHLPACSIEKKSHHGFNWKLTLAIVAGCLSLLLFLLVIYLRRKSGEKPSNAESLSSNSISKVSYKALYKATGGFSPSTLIGSGGFGSVYRGILDEKENDFVAIKVLNLQQRGASKSFTAECNALRNIRHRNLVKILTCCSSLDYKGNEFKALVFEYMPNGSLEEWLHSENQSRSLNLLQRLNIIVDVASALCYLHDHCKPQIVHCDMKPSNVLLDDDMVAHVGDLGLARLISTTKDYSQNQSSTVGIKGTIGYAAPEYAVGVEPSTQGDVYSFGILVLQMFTGKRPTDKMFKDSFNLHNFVKTALPGRMMQIVDASLLANVEETTSSEMGNEESYISSYNKVETEDNIDCENIGKMNSSVWNCILPILKIGLSCSEQSPRNRMSMEDVLRELQHIQKAYIGDEM